MQIAYREILQVRHPPISHADDSDWLSGKLQVQGYVYDESQPCDFRSSGSGAGAEIEWPQGPELGFWLGSDPDMVPCSLRFVWVKDSSD
jgi:hypothetical protein